MVCPVNRKRPKKVRQEDTAPVGDPEQVQLLLEALSSPDPAVRRAAAQMMEVSCLGALNAADTWRASRRTLK